MRCALNTRNKHAPSMLNWPKSACKKAKDIPLTQGIYQAGANLQPRILFALGQ